MKVIVKNFASSSEYTQSVMRWWFSKSPSDIKKLCKKHGYKYSKDLNDIKFDMIESIYVGEELD